MTYEELPPAERIYFLRYRNKGLMGEIEARLRMINLNESEIIRLSNLLKVRP